MFTHLDPNHFEGFRVVEQSSLDYRSWKAYLEKQIHLVIPETMMPCLGRIHSQYGPTIGYYIEQGFVECVTFEEKIKLSDPDIRQYL